MNVRHEDYWLLQEELARAKRHRGMMVGLVRGLLLADALGPEAGALARRVVSQVCSESSDAAAALVHAERDPALAREAPLGGSV